MKTARRAKTKTNHATGALLPTATTPARTIEDPEASAAPPVKSRSNITLMTSPADILVLAIVCNKLFIPFPIIFDASIANWHIRKDRLIRIAMITNFGNIFLMP